MYKSIIRPCLFRIDAEKIHDQIITLLHIYRHLGPIRSLTRSLFHPKAVPFQWQNLNFSNRVGLSAGFDKEANCFDELSDLGFGFIEVGTVTPHKVDGNPSPRIFRLPKDHALISRTGFNNPGKEMVLQNLGRNKTGNIYWESISIPIILPTKSWLEQKLQICTALSAICRLLYNQLGKHCSRNPQFRTDCSSRQKEADWQTYISEASG